MTWGNNCSTDFKKIMYANIGGLAIGALGGSLAGPWGAFVGSIIGSKYMEMSVEKNMLNNRTMNLQPLNDASVGYYNFFTIY